MATQTFYTTVRSVSFTLLGLWVAAVSVVAIVPAAARLIRSILVFFGVQVAWILMVEPARPSSTPPSSPTR